jgi:hypothetical protein
MTLNGPTIGSGAGPVGLGLMTCRLARSARQVRQQIGQRARRRAGGLVLLLQQRGGFACSARWIASMTDS